jgi:hypothetical protein
MLLVHPHVVYGMDTTDMFNPFMSADKQQTDCHNCAIISLLTASTVAWMLCLMCMQGACWNLRTGPLHRECTATYSLQP